MRDFSTIKKWTDEKKLERIKEIGRQLDKLPTDENPGDADIVVYLDEAIIIFLEICAAVILEKGWDGCRPTELLRGIAFAEGTTYMGLIGLRLDNTIELIRKFEAGNAVVKQRVRPALIARGII